MNVTKADWARYRDKLAPIIRHTEQRNQHQFSDTIISALSDERAFLFVAEDGFMVLQPVPVPGGVISVNVMFAYNDGNDAMLRYQPVIEQLARDIGGRSVHFYTKIAQLKPIAESVGYRQVSTDGGIVQFSKTL